MLHDIDIFHSIFILIISHNVIFDISGLVHFHHLPWAWWSVRLFQPFQWSNRKNSSGHHNKTDSNTRFTTTLKTIITNHLQSQPCRNITRVDIHLQRRGSRTRIIWKTPELALRAVLVETMELQGM